MFLTQSNFRFLYTKNASDIHRQRRFWFRNWFYSPMQHQVVQHLDDQQDRELGGSMVALNEALLPVGSQQDMIRLLGQRRVPGRL